MFVLKYKILEVFVDISTCGLTELFDCCPGADVSLCSVVVM